MRVKQSKIRGQKIAPPPPPIRRKLRRKSFYGMPRRQPPVVQLRSAVRASLDPWQWLAAVAIGLTSLALIYLIWTLTVRTIADQKAEIRTRADDHLRSVAAVTARGVMKEMAVVDQSLSIIQDAWKNDSETVDLGKWRRDLSALTAVADDIFIANERRVIVQGTLPSSIGQGVGTAYVNQSNGSLEQFDAEGTKNLTHRQSVESVTGSGIEARQFLMYIVKPLDRPRLWMVGASYRSEEFTKFFASARLGQTGMVALTDARIGRIQAVAGAAARGSEVNISKSELFDALKRNENGIWVGDSPLDPMKRIIAYARVPGRDLTVLVGAGLDSALMPAVSLGNWARGLATVGSLLVAAVGGLLLWSILTLRSIRRRQKIVERSELNLVNLRRELETVRARTTVTEPEVGTLMSSMSDGVARLDDHLRLRQWNARFGDLVGVPLDLTSLGRPVESLFRRQAESGLFGEPANGDLAVATRLTALHTRGQSVVPSPQFGPGGLPLMMHVRGVADGGHVIILAGPENARYASMPPMPEMEPEPAVETTDW